MESEPTQDLSNEKTPDAALEQANSLRKFTIKTQKLLLLQVSSLIIFAFVCLEESTLNLFHHKGWINERENISFDTYCMQYSQCHTYHYNRYYGDSYRQTDQINYNQWISETKKEVHTKSIVFYLGLILLPLDLLITLGFKMLSQDKLKQIQITHYYVQSFLLVYFTWSVLASVRFKQYFIKTILILLFQLIVIFITNFGLLLKNMYFKQQISLKKIIQYAINGIAMGLFIVVQFTDISRFLVHQLVVSIYLIYYFVQLDCSIQIEQQDIEYSIWSNIASGFKSMFSVNENYQEIAMTHFVISKKGLFKFAIVSIGILISMVLSYTLLNEGVFYITLYIFISTLQTQVQNTQRKNRLQPSEEYYGVTQIPMDIIMPARNLLRTFKN